MARGKLFIDLVTMTLCGVLFVIAAFLSIPGNIVFTVARKLFELSGDEEGVAALRTGTGRGSGHGRESAADTHNSEASMRSHGGGL